MGQNEKAKDALDHAAAAEAKAAAAVPPAGPMPDAPSSAEGQSIQKMAPDEQAQMIRGMVEKLAAKLEASPDDPAGWRQLARAYQVLGEKDKAENALARAADAEAKAPKP
jgi:cytochrome c-type biogenesis protein CcmH